jgi:hypothetical protein
MAFCIQNNAFTSEKYLFGRIFIKKNAQSKTIVAKSCTFGRKRKSIVFPPKT